MGMPKSTKLALFLSSIILLFFSVLTFLWTSEKVDEESKKTNQLLLEEALLQSRYGNYAESLNVLKRIDLRIMDNQVRFTLKFHGVYGRNYFGLELFEKSIESWSKSLNFIKNTSMANSRWHASVYNNIGSAYLNLEQPGQAYYFIEKSFNIHPIPDSYRMLSKLALDLDGDKQKSNEYLLKSIKSVEGEGFKYLFGLGNAYQGFGYQENYLCNYNAAIEYYIIAARCIEASSSADFILLKVYDKIVDLAEKINKAELKQHYTSKINKLRLSVNIQRNDALKLLHKDQAIQRQLLEERSFKRLILFVFTLIIVGCTIVLLVKRLRAKRNQLLFLSGENQKIHKLNQEYQTRINSAFDEVVLLAKSNDPRFIIRFKEVYPKVYNRIVGLSPNLTVADHVFLAMTWLNFSTKEIANYTFVQHKTVQIRKYRLRKKLNLSNDVEIIDLLKDV